MSFVGYKDVIEPGDTVIVYVNHRLTYCLTVKQNATFQTKFGALRHDYVIGKPFGCKVQLQRGYVHVLHPTPELWTSTLTHRTQILYPPDINVILLGLDLKPGSVVLEAGTGSGGLSHALARTIGAEGKLHTFDIVPERVQVARKEFDSHGFGQRVVVLERNVCDKGFPEDLSGQADAVFLDLPTPWLAIPAARIALKPSMTSRICTFSPCIEQVHRTIESLKSAGFMTLETVSTGMTTFKFNQLTLPSAKDWFAPSDPKKRKANRTELSEQESNPDERLKEKVAKMTAEMEVDSEAAKTGTDSSHLESVSDGQHSASESSGLEKDLEHCSRPKSKISDPCVYPVAQNVHSGYLTFATLTPCTRQ